jgi:hypothetical protein
MPAAGDGLTVAGTGPTGEIGKPFVAAVERLVARGTTPPKRCARRSRRSTPARSYAVTSVTGTPKRRSASPITSSSR